MTAEQIAIIAAENKRLCESRELIPVFEHLTVPATAIKRVGVAEANGRKVSTYEVATVSHFDRMNQNERVYPESEWFMQVENATGNLIPQGKLTGAVDHRGPFE